MDTVTSAVTTFLRVALQGLSVETKRWYRARLSLVAQALGETRPLSDVAEMDLIRLCECWESQRLAPDTLHGYIRALRRLFRWLYRRGMMSVDIAHEIRLPKLPKRGRSGITDEHAQAILNAAKQWSVRDHALLLMFATTSARRGGVARLKLSNLRIGDPEPFCRQVQVTEKGLKQRTVVMDVETYQALIAWLEVRPSGSEFVFVSDQGSPLKADSVSEVIDRYKKRLGIVGRCSPHQWRHRWFRRILSNGMPLTQAAQLGGHESTTVTYQFYGQFAVGELQEAYDKYHVPNSVQ
ncbi:MAG TPA: tyrosine-type recombinase/integrase [Anaerolineales bacterium]|nr:tyrosine-type recombinase/integrase [Anaerolineales bacterium]